LSVRNPYKGISPRSRDREHGVGSIRHPKGLRDDGTPTHPAVTLGPDQFPRAGHRGILPAATPNGR
jgi:hypothetical protein